MEAPIAPSSAKYNSKQMARQKLGTLMPPASNKYYDLTVYQLKLECTAESYPFQKYLYEDRVSVLIAYDKAEEVLSLLITELRQSKRSVISTEPDGARRSRHCVFSNECVFRRFLRNFYSIENQLNRSKGYTGFDGCRFRFLFATLRSSPPVRAKSR